MGGKESFHREVSVRSKSGDSWCHKGAKKTLKRAAILSGKPTPALGCGYGNWKERP